MTITGNQLQHETSPYLLQHADNPVHWYTWGKESLSLAKQLNKPILLSIGYSACHWCHVMAHESFEDADTAEIMNTHFINIKVDREERPDLDKIYQSAHSLLTGRAGGWPLTIFLTPEDQMPFFAGTYFPKEQHYTSPSFKELLLHISDIFRNRNSDIKKQNNSLKNLLSDSLEINLTDAKLKSLPLDIARQQILNAYDKQNGGFGHSPKFPHPAMIERAMRHWALTFNDNHNDVQILETANTTLHNMGTGGVFDQLGGGFYRYSTDNQWIIPHFEKMLYDNAQLLSLLAQAWQITNSPIFSDKVSKIAEWIIREMQSPDGGYYSAQDADSEGEEGKYFVWAAGEISNLLSPEQYKVFAYIYGLDRVANFENHWHLHQHHSYTDAARHLNLSEQNIFETLNECQTILFNYRSKRIAPVTDDKILTSWNALMIRSMCITGRITGNNQYLISAYKSIRFIYKKLWKDNRLHVTYRQNKSRLNAYLDDYAYLLLALIEYLQCTWDSEILYWAENIATELLRNFEDKVHGGFYYTSHDHEQLIQRSKIFADDAIPSGNGVAAIALQRLGLLLGNTDYLHAAERCLLAASNSMQEHAIMHCTMLNALEDYLNPPTVIIILGHGEAAKSWHSAVQRYYLPRVMCFVIPENTELPASMMKKPVLSDVCAYICEGNRCLPTIYSLGEALNYLKQKFHHISHHD